MIVGGGGVTVKHCHQIVAYIKSFCSEKIRPVKEDCAVNL